jgi:hypothetical protein
MTQGSVASEATIEHMERHRAGAVAGCAAAALLLASCAAPSSAASTPTPAANARCVTYSEATRIWTTVNQRLEAIELDPHHRGAATVTTGNALAEITSYLEHLVTQGLTEHEVDRLDQLTIVHAGCNGGRLLLNINMTVVQDDYLKAGGGIDHRDPSVGTTLNLLQEYVQARGSWKESDFSDLTPPGASPTPQLLRRAPAPCYTLLRSI